MIEFKGDCGHTIRAKDEDAGKVVRCSYCGREAPVPDEREDQFDFLLTEVERTGEFESPRKRRAAKPKSTAGKVVPARPRSDFNPFAVALKMCYAAIIITVLIVSGKYVYKQVITADRSARTAKSDEKETRDQGRGGASDQTRRTSGRGLLRPKLPQRQSGIFVNAVPPDAMVYVRCVRDASAVSILKDPRVKDIGRAGRQVNLPPDRYEVAVTVKMTDPALMRLAGYQETRRELEAPGKEKEQLGKELNDFFLPDRARRVALETLSDFSRVIVRYYEVEVVRDSWTPETALFLPRGLALSELMKLLPQEKVFGFDEGAVRMELEYYSVPEADRPFIIDALSQVGMVPYRQEAPGGRAKRPSYRLFRVGVMDGTISTTLVN